MADDLLQGLKDVIDNANPEGAAAGGGNVEDPKATMEQFLKALGNMPGLSDEDKENLAKSLSEGGLGGLGGSPLGGPVASPWLEFSILFGLISFIGIVLGYIGFRIYNSMVTRERKKEQKRLQKEQKKKK